MMNVERNNKYRVVGVFDRWPDDEIADHEDEEARARVDGRPLPILAAAAYQEVVLGGTFDAPTTEEIGRATATAMSFAVICEGRAEPRGHLVLDGSQWNGLVGTRAKAIDVAVEGLRARGFPAAAIAAGWMTAAAKPRATGCSQSSLQTDGQGSQIAVDTEAAAVLCG